MSEYNKLNIRFTNKGLNIVHDPTIMDFGEYSVLDNIVTNVEGQLTSRPGLTLMNSNAISESILGIRRLNDAVQGKSTYLVRGSAGGLYASLDGNSHATTTPQFTLTGLASGFSSAFGSVFVNRSSRSSQVWAYVGDTQRFVKVAINSNGTLTFVNVGLVRPQLAPVLNVPLCSSPMWTNLSTGGAGSVALTDSGATGQFAAYMVGSNIFICSGTNFQAGTYTIATFIDSNHVTLQTSPSSGGAGSAGNAIFPGAESGTHLSYNANYNYRYTFYDTNTGTESLFNTPDAAQVSTTVSQNTILVTVPTQSVSGLVTHARIYRQGGTNNDGLYHFVTQVAYTGTQVSVVDDFSDLSIATATSLNLVSDVPFSTTNAAGVTTSGTPLPYLFGPLYGYMLAVGDPNNPGYVYWTDKFNPDTQNPANNVEVTQPSDPIVNGLIYNGLGYCFTKETLYQLVPGIGLSVITPFKTSCGHGLVAPYAFCQGPEIYFLSKDGIYATNGGVERSLTEDTMRPLFNGQTVNGYPPVDYSAGALASHWMAYYKNTVYFHYKATDGKIYVLRYSLLYNRWDMFYFSPQTATLYNDEEAVPTQLLFGETGGNLDLHSGTADNTLNVTEIQARLQTGFITVGSPLIHKEWGAVAVDLNPNGNNVTVTVLANKGTLTIGTAVFNDFGRVRKMVNLIADPHTIDAFYEDIQLDVRWSSQSNPPILYGYELFYRPDAVQLTRWAAVNVDHGLEGWQIIRSAYITLRSDGVINLNVYPDNGAVHTYPIPTTNGQKQKVFIPFDPIKGKLFKYELVTTDNATYFRLYNENCEVHVKPWISALSYQESNPFLGGDSTPFAGSHLTSLSSAVPGGFLGGVGQNPVPSGSPV